MAKVTSTRLPGIMAHLVTSPDVLPSHSAVVGPVTSRIKGRLSVGVSSSPMGREPGERRTLLGIGTYVIDTPRDQDFHFRQRLRDYQERHRGVTKSQTDYLPVIPFRLNPRTEAGRDNSLSGPTQKSGVFTIPTTCRQTPSPNCRLSMANELYSSADRLDSCDRVSSFENQVDLHPGNTDLESPRGRGDGSSASNRNRKRGHAQSETKLTLRQEPAGSSLTQWKVRDASSRSAEPLPGLSNVDAQSWDLPPQTKSSPHTDPFDERSESSWQDYNDDPEFRPVRSFENSGPTSKHFSKQTKTRLLGDLIKSRNEAEAGKAVKESPELFSAYHKRQRIAQMLTKRGNYFSSRDIPESDMSDRDWMNLKNVQVVDQEDYDRYASRRRPGVSHGNESESVTLGCREAVDFRLLHAPNSRVRPEVSQRPVSQGKVRPSLDHLSIKPRSSLDPNKVIQTKGLT